MSDCNSEFTQKGTFIDAVICPILTPANPYNFLPIFGFSFLLILFFILLFFLFYLFSDYCFIFTFTVVEVFDSKLINGTLFAHICLICIFYATFLTVLFHICIILVISRSFNVIKGIY